MLPVGRPPTSSHRMRRSSSIRERLERTSDAIGLSLREGAGEAEIVARETRTARIARRFGNRIRSPPLGADCTGRRIALMLPAEHKNLSIEGGIRGNQQ